MGFIILGILTAILIIYLINLDSSLIRILSRIEESMDSIGDATMELIDEVRDNVFFRMLFREKKKHRGRTAKDSIIEELKK